MGSFIFITILALYAVAAIACLCTPNSLQEEYFRSSTVSYVLARVTSKRSTCTGTICSTGSPVHYTLSISQSYKSCREGIVGVRSPASSISCGINLSVGVYYVIPLPSKTVFRPNLSLCQYIRPYSLLTSSEISFLNSRKARCPLPPCGGPCHK